MPDLDLSPLYEAVLSALTYLVPVVTAFVTAWFSRRTLMLKTVENKSVEAEKLYGGGHGLKKHASVRDKLKKTMVGKTFTMKSINELIAVEGRDAANAYRESITPPESKK